MTFNVLLGRAKRVGESTPLLALRTHSGSPSTVVAAPAPLCWWLWVFSKKLLYRGEKQNQQKNSHGNVIAVAAVQPAPRPFTELKQNGRAGSGHVPVASRNADGSLPKRAKAIKATEKIALAREP